MHSLALDGVGDANRAGLRDGRVGDERRLELGRADPLAGDVERVVRATMQKPLAVLLVRRPVAMRPDAVVAIPVRLEVAIGCIPQATRHARPGAADHELADRIDERVALGVEHIDVHARDWAAQRAGSHRQRHIAAENDRADFCAAGNIDDRDAAVAHDTEQPRVRLGIPRLTCRAEGAQCREVDRTRQLITVAL